MWSHHADRHKGVCLEYSVRNDLFSRALPIEYLESYAPCDVSAGDEDENLRVLLVKSLAWRYEDEFRVVAEELPYTSAGVLSTKDGFVRLPQGALQSVTVGALMPLAERQVVRSLVEQSGWGIALKEALRASDRYKLEVGPLS